MIRVLPQEPRPLTSAQIDALCISIAADRRCPAGSAAVARAGQLQPLAGAAARVELQGAAPAAAEMVTAEYRRAKNRKLSAATDWLSTAPGTTADRLAHTESSRRPAAPGATGGTSAISGGTATAGHSFFQLPEFSPLNDQVGSVASNRRCERRGLQSWPCGHFDRADIIRRSFVFAL